MSGLAAAVAYRLGRGRLGTVLVASGGRGWHSRHQRNFLWRDRGNSCQHQQSKNSGVKFAHSDGSPDEL